MRRRREVIEIIKALEPFYWYHPFVGEKVVAVYDDAFPNTVQIFFQDQPDHIKEKLDILYDNAHTSIMTIQKCDIKIVDKTLAVILMELKREVKEQLPDEWLA